MIRWSIIIPIWYALMQMMQQRINNATTTLKTEYILWTNKIALTLVYVFMLSNKALLPHQCFSYTNPSCFFISFYRFNHYSKQSVPSKLIIIELQNYSEYIILLGTYYQNFRSNNITNLPQKFLQVLLLTILSTLI